MAGFGKFACLGSIIPSAGELPTVKAPGIPQEPALHLSEAKVFLLDF